MKTGKTLAKFAPAALMVAALCLAATLTGCASDGGTQEESTETSTPEVSSIEGMDFEYTGNDVDASWDESSAVHVDLAGSTATSDAKSGVSIEGSTVTITAEGTYVLEGELDGQVVVDATSSDKIQLVLNGVEITNASGPCIYIAQADKVFVTLAEGADNVLSDAQSSAYDVIGDEEVDAVVYSKDDLTFNGTGSLTIDASFAHGIKSKDDLVITGGVYAISATTDCLRGKDCVKICDGTFVLTAGSDCIQSSNDSDDTRGFVSIDGGSFVLVAGDDGIQGYTYVRVMDGEVSITSTDDAIHSDGAVYIAGGDLDISAGDDAVHGETVLTVDDGDIAIATCYEGLEAEKIYCNGGGVSIIAKDDGINASSAEVATDSEESEAEANDGRPDGGIHEGGGMGAGDENCLIQINGGTVYIDSTGDSIDSNGSVEITGGTVLVCGPTSDGDAAFDYDLNSTISGGTVLMVGSSGMAQNFTSGTQPFVFASASGSAGDEVTLSDAEGNVLISLTATKRFEVVQASCADFSEGSTYTLSVGGQETEVTASTTATSGFGGLGSGGDPRSAGQGGEVMQPGRGGGGGMGQSQPTAPGGSQEQGEDPGAQRSEKEMPSR